MARVTIDNVESGMKLARDVVNARGQVLIPAGSTLEDRQLRGLKIWGVKAVFVEGSALSDSDVDGEARVLSPQAREEIENHIAYKFSLNEGNLDHPLLVELKKLSFVYLEGIGAPKDSLITNVMEGNLEKSSLSELETSSLTVEELLQKSQTVASPPDIYSKLLNVMKKPSSSAKDIAEVISNDPGLTARLLRIVNSAFYAFPSKIETVSRAITIIGTNELTDLVLATSVLTSFDGSLDAVVSMEKFWKHSLSCGFISRAIAQQRHEQNLERFFVTGLLHDIGRLLVLSSFPKRFELASNKSVQEKIPLVAAEKEVLGFTHCEVGSALMKTWNLPISQQEAVGYHHKPQFSRRFPIDSSVVHIADVCINAIGIGSSGSSLVPQFIPEAWDRINVDISSITKIAEDVETHVEDLMEIVFSK